MDDASVSTDDHRVLRGLLLALLALAGGLFLSLLLAGPAAAAHPPAAPALLDEVVDGTGNGDGTVPDVADETPAQAPDATGAVAASVAAEDLPAAPEAPTDGIAADPAPQLVEAATDAVASGGASADEVLEKTPLAEALPPVEDVVTSASSIVAETLVEPLVAQVDVVPEPVDAPLAAPAVETAEGPATVGGGSTEAPVSASGPGSSLAGSEASPDSGVKGFPVPDGIDLLPVPAPSSSGADLTPAGSSGPSSSASGSGLVAAEDAFPLEAFLHVTSSLVENDDVPAAPTYESDTTPD